MEPETIESLNNQVLLMISEYHWTCVSQGSSSVSPVLPEVAEDLLPPLDQYLSGDFQGSRDVRVKDKANSLRVATWLHHLDTAAAFSKAASTSLEASRHGMGPLLEYFLVLKTSNLTLQEIAQRVMMENRQEVEESLEDLRQCWDDLKYEIESLSQTREREKDKDLKKTHKRKLDQKRRDLQRLETSMSHQQHLLGQAGSHSGEAQGRDDDHSNSETDGATEEDMVTTQAADDALSASITHGSASASPSQEQAQVMDVDQPPGSPVSPNEDDLLTGGTDTGVEREMANLMVSTPERQDGHN